MLPPSFFVRQAGAAPVSLSVPHGALRRVGVGWPRCGGLWLAALRQPIPQLRQPIPPDYESPTISPFSSMSMPSAAGFLGKPGIVMMSPHSATRNSAPVER